MENCDIGIVLDEGAETQEVESQEMKSWIASMAEVTAGDPVHTRFIPRIETGQEQLCDASGEFGSPSNPILVNGPIGLFTYLNTLRSNRGRPFAQTYAGTIQTAFENRIVDAIYLQELIEQSPREFHLFFCFYGARRSRKIPPFCSRVAMEPTAANSEWQTGYKQPFMFKVPATFPILGFGGVSQPSAGVMKCEKGLNRSFMNAGSPHLSRGLLNNLHITLFLKACGDLRHSEYVLKDEARLRRMSNESCEEYWQETFGRDIGGRIVGSGKTASDPVVMQPMNNLAAAAVQSRLLSVAFGRERVDWLTEERRYPGDGLLEYRVRLSTGKRASVYFDLSRLNDRVDNRLSRVSKSLIGSLAGQAPTSDPPRLKNSLMSSLVPLPPKRPSWLSRLFGATMSRK
jgi:hypothetical protein